MVLTSANIKRMLNAFLLPLFGLSVYGYWADFIPSQKWAEAGMYISISLTLLSCGAFYWTILTGMYQLQAELSEGKKTLFFLVFPIVVFFVCWFSTVHGIADVATTFFGSTSIANATLEKKITTSRGCKYRLIGDYLTRTSRNQTG